MTRRELTDIQAEKRHAAENAAHDRFMSRRANFIESNPNAVSPSERQNFARWEAGNADLVNGWRNDLNESENEVRNEAARTAENLANQAAADRPRQVANALQPGDNALDEQYSRAVATAQAALRRRMTGGATQLGRIMDDILGKGNGQTVASVQSAPGAAQQTALAGLKRQLANRANAPAQKPAQTYAPTYDYGGVTVSLPKSLNLGDSAAVAAAMNENNELIDWMNGLYEAEV